MRKLFLACMFMLMICLHFCCTTEKKVNGWLNEHPTDAAGYCADRFPPDTITRVMYDSVDTKAYEAAYWEMARYADSLFSQLETARNAFVATPEHPCPPPVNLDSLRKAVDVQIRKRLFPCKDSIQKVVYTVRDPAREKELRGIIDELQKKLDAKDAVISARDKTITENNQKIHSLQKWKLWFWILVGVMGLYVFLKIRYKLPI